MIFFFFYIIFCGENILGIFTDKQVIIDLGNDYLFWAVIACLINPLCFIWDGVFIGAGQKVLR